jgi:hypothetical protein
MGASPFVHCHPLYAGRARVKKSVVRYPGTIANARPRIGEQSRRRRDPIPDPVVAMKGLAAYGQ